MMISCFLRPPPRVCRYGRQVARSACRYGRQVAGSVGILRARPPPPSQLVRLQMTVIKNGKAKYPSARLIQPVNRFVTLGCCSLLIIYLVHFF